MKSMTCSVCGGAMFVTLPGQAASEDIVAFASQMLKKDLERRREWELAVEKGWLRPGAYCPNGCSEVLFDLRPADLECDLEVETAEATLIQNLTWLKQARSEQVEEAKTRWGYVVCEGCGQRLSTWADSDRWQCGYCQRPLDLVPVPEPIATSFSPLRRRYHINWEERWAHILAEEIQAASTQETPPKLLDLVTRLRNKTSAPWLTLYNFTKDYCERHNVALVRSLPQRNVEKSP